MFFITKPTSKSISIRCQKHGYSGLALYARFRVTWRQSILLVEKISHALNKNMFFPNFFYQILKKINKMAVIESSIMPMGTVSMFLTP